MLHKTLFLLLMSLARAALKIDFPTSSLIENTVEILLRNFQGPFVSAWMVQNGSSLQAEKQLGDVLDAVIAQLRGTIPVQYSLNRNKVQLGPSNRNVLLVNDYEAFHSIYSALSLKRNDFSGRYLIVVSSVIDKSFVQKVFDDLWKLQIVNVVMVGMNSHLNLKRWTYFPYFREGCGQARLIRLGPDDELYPDKTGNFHGCRMKVGSFETRPFTIMNRSVEESLTMNGFEGDLLDLLKARLNFSIKIYEPGNGEQWGYALAQNSTGLAGMIQDKKVDFGISCMGISVAKNEILQPGIAHYTTALVLAIPKGRPFTPMEKLFHPFEIEVWYCIGAILLGSTIVITNVELATENVRDFVYGRKVRSPYLNLIRVLFATTMVRLPTRNFARTLLFLWIYFCFVIQSLYQGALYQYLQTDSTLPSSQSMSEIDRTDALYYVVESGERYYTAFPDRYRRVRHLPQEKNNIITRLEWMMHHPESSNVVMGSLDHLAHHNLLHRRKGGFINVCPEFVSTYTVAIYYPKGSMLTTRFDREIMRFQTSGLMSHWIGRYGDYDFLRGKSEGSQPKKLSFTHLSAVFEICGTLWGLSIVVFVLELTWARYKSINKFLLNLFSVK